MTNDRMTAADRQAEAFATARGVEADRDWALEALMVMTMRDLAPPAVEESLAEARALVRSTGESPEELFGPPRAWVEDQVALRREEGRVVASAEPDTRWRDVPVLASVVAALLSLVLCVLMAVRGEWHIDLTAGVLALPLVSGLTVMTALTTFETVLTRRPFWLAALLGLVVGAVGVGALTAAFMLGNPHPVGRVHVTVLLATAVGYAVLAAVLERLLPAARPRVPAARLTDEEWSRRLAGVLRLRAFLPEERVRVIIAEAQDHAAQAGTGLAAEFGRPEDYAARYLPDVATRSRRRLWLSLALLPVAALAGFGDGFTWWGLALVVVAAWLVLDNWRDWRRDEARAAGRR